MKGLYRTSIMRESRGGVVCSLDYCIDNGPAYPDGMAANAEPNAIKIVTAVPALAAVGFILWGRHALDYPVCFRDCLLVFCGDRGHGHAITKHLQKARHWLCLLSWLYHRGYTSP